MVFNNGLVRISTKESVGGWTVTGETIRPASHTTAFPIIAEATIKPSERKTYGSEYNNSSGITHAEYLMDDRTIGRATVRSNGQREHISATLLVSDPLQGVLKVKQGLCELLDSSHIHEWWHSKSPEHVIGIASVVQRETYGAYWTHDNLPLSVRNELLAQAPKRICLRDGDENSYYPLVEYCKRWIFGGYRSTVLAGGYPATLTTAELKKWIANGGVASWQHQHAEITLGNDLQVRVQEEAGLRLIGSIYHAIVRS